MLFYVSTFRRMCAVPNMAVFCSSRTSWLPGMLPTYSLNHFQMVPVAPIITGITVVFTFHARWISIVRSSYFKNFFSFFLDYITISWDGNIYQYACPLFIISDYNIWLIVRNSSVRSYWLIPQYGDIIIIISCHLQLEIDGITTLTVVYMWHEAFWTFDLNRSD